MGSVSQGKVRVGVSCGCGFLEEVRSPVTQGECQPLEAAARASVISFEPGRGCHTQGLLDSLPQPALLSHQDLGSHQVMDNPKDSRLKEIA